MTANDPELRRALVAHTYQQLPAAMGGSGFVALGVAFVALRGQAGAELLAWSLLELFVHAANAVIYFAYVRGLFANTGHALWARRFGVFLTAIGWAVAVVLWPASAPELGFGMCFCIAGLMAGATMSLAGDPWSYALFAAVALAPELAIESSVWRTSSMFLVAFFVATCFIVHRNALVLRSSLALRWENAELLAQTIREREDAEAARAEAVRAARAKTRFLAAASHDLRQPMQALTLFVDVLARDPEPPRDERARAVAALDRTSQALGAMLDGLFDLSRLDAGLVVSSPRPVALALFLEDVAAGLHDEAAERDVFITVAGRPLTAFVDPALFARVVHNLASNAVRHGGPGRVLLAMRRRGGCGVLEVWDQGPGIAEVDRERIFEEFVQLANAERDRSRGLGLGLATVTRLCALNGWTLTLRSVLGKGTVFRVAFPLAKEEVRAASRPPESRAGRRRGVLLVEDDILVREAATGFFEAGGFRVDAVSTGDLARDALVRLEAEGRRPDVLVSDHRLPGSLSGAALVRELRTGANPMPAVLMSGDLDAPFLHEEPPAGVTVLRKPVRAEALLQAVTELLRD